MKAKTLITTLAIVLALAGSAYAAPFLSSNPYTGTVPAYFMLSIDGGTAVQSTAYTCTGAGAPVQECTAAGTILRYDLSGLATGSHTATASACTATTPSQGGTCTATSAAFPFSLVAAPSGGTPVLLISP